MLRFLLAFCVFQMLLAASAAAHLFDEGGVIIEVWGAERDEETGDVSVSLTVTNATGETVTMRGVGASAGESATVMGNVRFLGFEVERELRFVTVDPGETRSLAPPEGRVLVRSVAEDDIAGVPFFMRLYFGPVGALDVAVWVGALPEFPALDDVPLWLYPTEPAGGEPGVGEPAAPRPAIID